MAELYEAMGRYSEAEPLYGRALGILTKSLGENHPHTQSVMSALMMLKIQNLTGLDATTL